MSASKFVYVLFAIVIQLFVSCTDDKHLTHAESKAHKITVGEFQSILDSAKIMGSVLIYDLKTNTYYSNDFERVNTVFLPASTFKIPHTIIALETGVIESDSTLFEWKGEQRAYELWEQDLTLKDAFRFSCVPCYQETARKIGAKCMAAYLKKLDYGNMKFDSATIDLFWLEGKSGISQMEQIDFLKRFFLSELPVSKRTERMVKRMMVMEQNTDYKLSGKTGWSVSSGCNNGWFVGYLETRRACFFFASNVEPTDAFDMNKFPMIRQKVTMEAFRVLEIID